jgi:hypothetical protein
MLRKAKVLRGYKLGAMEGEIGKVEGFYFDDRHWTVRYVVIETGDWLTDRQVLISPYAMVSVEEEKEIISTNLTKKQIEASPPLDAHKPISRQFEKAYYQYYGWPMYWYGPYMWGPHQYPSRDGEKQKEETQAEMGWDAHLRSTQAVTGYHIQAKDGEIGHVEDFVIDDKTWAIRYMIVDTRNWWPGKQILVSPQWIEEIAWGEAKVFVNLSRETIQQGPEYTEESRITRNYETGLYQHYNRAGYWADERPAEKVV